MLLVVAITPETSCRSVVRSDGHRGALSTALFFFTVNDHIQIKIYVLMLYKCTFILMFKDWFTVNDHIHIKIYVLMLYKGTFIINVLFMLFLLLFILVFTICFFREKVSEKWTTHTYYMY